MSDIKKLFQYGQDRNIWRIIITDLEQIVIEERDIEKKEVFFSCLDRVTGKFYWRDKKFLDEKFWIGIEGSRSKYLVLHQFEKPDMPNHKKIINVDLISGEVIWVNDNLTFYDMDENFIYGYAQKFDEREYFQLSIEDGSIKNSLGNEEQSKFYLNSISEKDYSRYLFTETIGQFHQRPKELITKIIGDNSFINFCEFIEHRNYFIFNYYDKIAPHSLTNRLVIFDNHQGKTVLTETLNLSTPAPVPDSFFVFDDDLYFIKNKTELVAYRLKSEEDL